MLTDALCVCLYPLCKASRSVMRWNGGINSVVACVTVDRPGILSALGRSHRRQQVPVVTSQIHSCQVGCIVSSATFCKVRKAPG
jgi:hypothetical protein